MLLCELQFRYKGTQSVIHIGTRAQCMKTVAVYRGAYDLLKDHSVFAGKDIEYAKECFHIEPIKG